MTPADLRALVAVMRELGVISADGVTLGPEPTRAADLQRAAKTEKDPAVRKALEYEAEKERVEEARRAWHDATREMLAATGDYSDEECERYRPFVG